MTDDERQWHAAQCSLYRDEYPVYQAYAPLIDKILRAACAAHGVIAIVQVRPKAFSSFAEKMARKAERYRTQNIGPTDLCGGRVITDTTADAEKVCTLIRGAFRIDEENSLDARSRLLTDEFGYLSWHYVVQLKGTEMFGVPISSEDASKIGDFKAEIQVRTLLQHAYASIAHDRLYKTSLLVQESLKREMARTAALLEEADSAFGNCVRALDSYRVHYGTYMGREKLKEETEILQWLLQNEPVDANKPAMALRLAQLERTTFDYGKVAALLEPFLGMPGGLIDRELPDVLAEYGHALCRIHAESPQSQGFQDGVTRIDQALPIASGSLKGRSLGYRAWALSKIPDGETEASAAWADALDADPSNPFHLASFLEYKLYIGEKLSLRSALAPTLNRAICKCRQHIEAAIEVPWSFMAMGRFNLLLDDSFASLAAYSKVIQLCLDRDSTIPLSALDDELTFVRRINRGREIPENHQWICTLLLLGRTLWTKKTPAWLAAGWTSFTKPVVILAGGASPANQGKVDRFRATVKQSFEGFQGTIISGGTRSGVPGLAGEIAASVDAQVLGYIPHQMPWDQPVDSRYTAQVPSGGQSYSAGHALRYWTDLILAGVVPEEVRLLGIDGGEIAAFEYRLALALGARVGVMEPASRAAMDLLRDPDWRGNRHLIGLLDDLRSVEAFVQPPQPRLTGEQLEIAAQEIHAEYLKEKHYKNPDPAMQRWEKLDDQFKNSNRLQAAAAAGFLERAGFTISAAAGDEKTLKLTKKEIELLSEMEHGRWNVERLQDGWRYGEKRDTQKKTHPSLIGWKQLPDGIKEWDRSAVRNWPRTLANAGFRVSRRPAGQSPRHPAGVTVPADRSDIPPQPARRESS